MQAQPDNVRTPDGVGPSDLDDIEQHVVRPTASHDVSVEETDGGQYEVTVPISSTSEHRSGGVMTELALEDMAAQLRDGTVGLWDDHGLDEAGWREYRREDMYGWWVEATIEDDVLWATARLRAGDPRSDDLVDQLEQGMPIGFSVGYIPLEDEWVEREDGEQREIIRVDLMECSPVGIPDNRDAYANAGAELASALADVGVDVTPELSSAIADSVTDTLTQMSNSTETDTDPGEANEGEPEDTESENRTHETRSAAEGALATLDIMQSHMDAAAEEVQEWAEAETDEDDEEEEDYDKDDEEDAGSDGDDDDEDDDESKSAVTASADIEDLRSEFNSLREENKELRAKVDRLESESREPEGRRGIVTTDGDDQETNDEEPTDNHTPRSTTEEAALFAMED